MIHPGNVVNRVSQIEEQTDSFATEDGEQWLSTTSIILIAVFSVIAIGAIAYSSILIRRLRRTSLDDDNDDELSMSTGRDLRPRSARSVQYVCTKDRSVPTPAPPRHHPRKNLTSASLSGLADRGPVQYRKRQHDHHQRPSSHSVNYLSSQDSAPARRTRTFYRPRHARTRSADSRNNVCEDEEKYSSSGYANDELDDKIDDFLDFAAWQKENDARRPRVGGSKVRFSSAPEVSIIHDIALAASEVSDAGQLIGKTIANEVQNMAGEILSGAKNDVSPSGEASVFSWLGSSHQDKQQQVQPRDDLNKMSSTTAHVADLEKGIPISTITVPRLTEKDNRRKKSSRAKHVVRLW